MFTIKIEYIRLLRIKSHLLSIVLNEGVVMLWWIKEIDAREVGIVMSVAHSPFAHLNTVADVFQTMKDKSILQYTDWLKTNFH